MRLICISIIMLIILYILNDTRINKIANTECTLQKNNDYTQFIHGYWTSNDQFAKESEIDEMILDLDTKSMTGLLIIIVDNKITYNDEFDIILYPKSNEIEFVSNNIKFIWADKKFKMNVSINSGSMILYNIDKDSNRTIYANLIKDNKITSLFKEDN